MVRPILYFIAILSLFSQTVSCSKKRAEERPKASSESEADSTSGSVDESEAIKNLSKSLQKLNERISGKNLGAPIPTSGSTPTSLESDGRVEIPDDFKSGHNGGSIFDKRRNYDVRNEGENPAAPSEENDSSLNGNNDKGLNRKLLSLRSKAIDEIISAKPLDQKVLAAEKFVLNFDFQKLSGGENSNLPREELLAEALREYLQTFDLLLEIAQKEFGVKDITSESLRAPEDNLKIDNLYALSFVSSYIDNEQSLVVKKSGGSETSIYQLIKESLLKTSSCNSCSRAVSEKSEEYKLIYLLQLRYNFFSLLALRRVFEFEKSTLDSLSAFLGQWAPDYSDIKSKNQIDGVVHELIGAIEVRELLNELGSPPIEWNYNGNIVYKLNLGGILSQMQLGEESFNLNSEVGQSRLKVARLFEYLRAPYVDVPLSEEAKAVYERVIRGETVNFLQTSDEEIKDQEPGILRKFARGVLNLFK